LCQEDSHAHFGQAQRRYVGTTRPFLRTRLCCCGKGFILRESCVREAMDSNDDDLQMLDVQGTSPRTFAQSFESARIRSNSLVMPSGPIVPPRVNRSQDSQRRGTPISDNGNLNRSVRRLRERSRDSSILANSVASQLSIKTSNDMPIAMPGESMDHSDGEHEPVAPYRSSLPTGLCYDVRMRYHCELDPPKQRLDYHPEDPRRIFKIYKELCMAGLVKDPLLNTGTLIPNPLVNIPVREVGEDEVCLVHDKSHFDFMKTTAGTFCHNLCAHIEMLMALQKCLPRSWLSLRKVTTPFISTL
jgi:hypothetical protein